MRLALVVLVCLLTACASAPLYGLGPFHVPDESSFFARLEASVRDGGYQPVDVDPRHGVLRAPMRSAPAVFRVQAARRGEDAVVLVVVEGAGVRYVGARQRMSPAMSAEYDSFTIALRARLAGHGTADTLGSPTATGAP